MEQKFKIIIFGGAGYVGSELVPKLLASGHLVTVVDLMIYGDSVLKKHPNLIIEKGDIRNIGFVKKLLVGQDVVIHLACISNDPSFELNPSLGKSINFDCFEPLVRCAKDSGISRFIFASSSSVYGVKSEQNVTEDMVLEPLTDYSLFKVRCEQTLKKYQSNDFTTIILRPATVCGYAPRQRLDVIVNIFTNLAFHKREISIFGGKQLRPNIHIKDMVKAYILALSAPKTAVHGEAFNIGFQNHSVNEIGRMVADVVGSDVAIKTVETNDNRSYHVSSEKAAKVLKFQPQFTISDAVQDLKIAFERQLLSDPLHNELYFNIKRMQSLNLE